jgi:hypothetical protein
VLSTVWPLDQAGQHKPGHHLARLDHRRVVVLQQLDPAYPAGEELVRRDFELVLDVVPLRLVHPPSRYGQTSRPMQR